MHSTTTCKQINWLKTWEYPAQVGGLDEPQEVSPTDVFRCTTVVSTSSPLYTRDSGDILFGLAIVICLLGMIFMGLVFTSFNIKK